MRDGQEAASMDRPEQQAKVANMEAIAAEQPAATLERKGLNGGPQREAPRVISEAEGQPDALEAARQWLAREHAATERLFEQPLEAARGDSAAGPSMQPAGSHWQAPVNAGPGVREMGAAAGQEVAISLMNVQVCVSRISENARACMPC